jgi:hypothetical protein
MLLLTKVTYVCDTWFTSDRQYLPSLHYCRYKLQARKIIVFHILKKSSELTVFNIMRFGLTDTETKREISGIREVPG